MKTNILLLVCTVLALSSCGTFKSGQTPDDVYYSPTRVITEEKKEEAREEPRRNDSYNYEDRALRMRVAEGRRWASLENPYYYDNYRYDYNCNCNCNNHLGYNYGFNNNWTIGNRWNNQWGGWNGYYNPVVVLQPAKPKYIAPRGGSWNTGNGSGYSNRTYNNTNSNTNSKSNGGGLINRIFNGDNNSSNNNSTPRAYEPSRSSGSSNSGSSSGGSSGGSVSRPGRSGR